MISVAPGSPFCPGGPCTQGTNHKNTFFTLSFLYFTFHQTITKYRRWLPLQFDPSKQPSSWSCSFQPRWTNKLQTTKVIATPLNWRDRSPFDTKRRQDDLFLVLVPYEKIINVILSPSNSQVLPKMTWILPSFERKSKDNIDSLICVSPLDR